MPKEKVKRLPVRIQKLIGWCKTGQVLCVGLRKSDVGETRQYWLEPSGRPAGAKSVEEAIALGLLKPSGDGLFDDSQTWVAS